MSRYKKDSHEHKVKQTLIERFEDGEKLSVDKIVAKYYSISSPLHFLTTRVRVKSLLSGVKNHFLKEGIPFGCLNDKFQHGIPETKEEYEYLCLMGYKFWKGIRHNMQIIANAGVREGVLKIRAAHDNYPKPLLTKGK